jgi:thiosulfate dehydrogenase (quinone) large subunit
MLVSFLESIKYTGHLLPIVFLRVFLGYYFILQALAKWRGDFLSKPRIAEMISEFLPASQAPQWYKVLAIDWLVPHWHGLAFAIVGLEFAIGISYLLGYVVRPMAILAALYCLQMHAITPKGIDQLQITFVGMHLTLAWIGAGRCVGIDYYFYKRRRGLWW